MLCTFVAWVFSKKMLWLETNCENWSCAFKKPQDLEEEEEEKKKNPNATIMLIRADLLRWVKLCPRLPKWVRASDTILLNVTNLWEPWVTTVLLIRVWLCVWSFAKVNYEEHIRLAVNPMLLCYCCVVRTKRNHVQPRLLMNTVILSLGQEPINLIPFICQLP